MKQTAVEWLISEIKSQLIARVTELDLYSLQQQAKEMEKQQIMNAYGIKTFRTIKMGLDVYEQINGEQYYNETYK